MAKKRKDIYGSGVFRKMRLMSIVIIYALWEDDDHKVSSHNKRFKMGKM